MKTDKILQNKWQKEEPKRKDNKYKHWLRYWIPAEKVKPLREIVYGQHRMVFQSRSSAVMFINTHDFNVRITVPHGVNVRKVISPIGTEYHLLFRENDEKLNEELITIFQALALMASC